MIMKNRDNFSSKWGFILACIGSAVGMGNIWRFPVMVSTYGGLTFLLPYILFVVLIASTGVMEEFSFGRWAESGPVGAFGKAFERKYSSTRLGGKKARYIGRGIGALPVLGSMALAIGYTVVMAWIFKYTYLAISGDMIKMGSDMGKIGGTFGATATTWGANIWVVVAIIVAFIIMALGVSGGIEKANKIMMPLLFFMMLALGIYIAFLPGSSNGYKYIFSFNGKGLGDIKVWIFAFGQAFFSLSVAGNGSLIYGSYLSKDEDIPSSARNVAIFDTLAALLAAMVIIPAMATAGEELSSGGPGLMFIYLVNVMNGLPLGVVVEIVFFVAVTFAGVSSIINLYEAPVAFLQEEFKMKRVTAVLSIVLLGGIIAICIQGITSEWMDVVSIYICPLGALLAGVIYFWISGKDFALEEVNIGAEKKVGSWFYYIGKYLFCPLALIALVLGAIFGGIG